MFKRVTLTLSAFCLTILASILIGLALEPYPWWAGIPAYLLVGWWCVVPLHRIYENIWREK